MQLGFALLGQHKFKSLAVLLLTTSMAVAQQPCAVCHPKEVAGYAKTGMARSLATIDASPLPPDGSVRATASQTEFSIHSVGAKMIQQLSNATERVEQAPAFTIGSGNHAFGYLVETGDHIFQSPLSYYTQSRIWGLAPGYEQDPQPDFSRPVTDECLSCHSNRPLAIAGTLNRYQPGVFAGYAISCERCHGDTAAHLKKPVPGSILNPAKLIGAARASICEQCHLTGEIRIPNPGKSLTDFQPGQVLEDDYTVYVAAKSSGERIKVVSHAEQLALSQCARHSGDKLWCGTCHNPHDKPSEPVAYFRAKCLTCHGATLQPSHGMPSQDCIACHMPKLPTTDGGHTAFTDHRIARVPGAYLATAQPDTLTAWRQPPLTFADRNLALALVTYGLETGSAQEVIAGYRSLNRVESKFPEDVAVLTSLGSVLMKGKQPMEAAKRFKKVVRLKPDDAAYRVNLAAALLALHEPEEAARELREALNLDPLLQPAIQMLSELYRSEGQSQKADELRVTYDRAMHITRH